MTKHQTSSIVTGETEAGKDAYCTTGTSPTTNGATLNPEIARQQNVIPAPRVHPQHQIGHELVGRMDRPTIVVLGGISAHRHICATPTNPTPGWWEEIVGPNARGVDTNEFSVLGVDWLRARRGERHPITTRDQAVAIADALDSLQIDNVAAIVGASYGGMVALAFATLYPSRVDRVVAISAAHRTHPMATALRSLQRRVVRLGQKHGDKQEVMSIARGIAMTTYRTAAEFESRFDVFPEDREDRKFPVEGYLENRGRVFAETFDAETFLCLSESIDEHRVDPTSIDVPLTLVAVESDSLVPDFLVRELASNTTAACDTHVIQSQYGHDAFLKEHKVIAEIVRNAINPPSDCRRSSGITGAVRAAIDNDTQYGSVMPAIHLTANFSFRDLGEQRSHDYTRSGNPTRDHLVDAIVGLERGAGGVVTSSGMSAIAVVTQLLRPNDLLLAPIDCYGGTRRLFDSLVEQGRCKVQYALLSDADGVRSVVKTNAPKMIWVETPSNPLLQITDIQVVCDIARDVGALVAVDNTFLSPALQTPIDFGADFVVHSTTKFLNGHSDVVGGAIVAREKEIADQLVWWANCLGVTGAPFDSYLTLRGVRTLHARVAAHAVNSAAVVDVLTGDDRVRRVYHPSIPTHPGHRIAERQQKGWGSIVSFELNGGDVAVRAFVKSLEHFTLAESLGGVESLVAHPATMTHAAMTEHARAEAGITSALLRLSVGIEDGDDLTSDLRHALGQAGRAAV